MTDDLVGRLEAWADNDAEYGHHGQAEDWCAAKARIKALEGEKADMAWFSTQREAPRVSRRQFHLSHAAIAEGCCAA